MRTLLIPIFSLSLLAAPAAAQEPAYPPEADPEIARALPDQAELQAMTHGIDRLLGALLEIDVAPLLDAADPYGRHDPYARERTLRDMAERDDPYFEERLRSNLYGVTANMGRMMETFAVMAPALRRSLETLEQDIEAAAEDYRRRR